MSGTQTALFGKKDLGLLLSDKCTGITYTARNGDADIPDEHKFEPKIDPTKKVFRYRAGKKPSWLGESDEEEEVEIDEEEEHQPQTPVGEEPRQDRRLARLSALKQDADGRSAALARRKRFQAEVVAEVIEEEVVEATEEEQKAAAEEPAHDPPEDSLSRRQRIRAALLSKQAQQQEELPVEEEDESESDSSEYETDTSDDEYFEGSHRTLKKPTFVSKENRATVIKRQQQQQLEEDKFQRAEQQAKKRAEQSRQLVVDEVRKAEQEGGSSDSDLELMPDDSDNNQEAEFELWKIRELKRIKRYQEKRQKLEADKNETDRRRKMTDEERRRDDLELIKKGLKKDPNGIKTKIKFMQKYYHKGSFYMDDESLEQNDPRKKSYNEPTLEDKFDKTLLPKVMQVKKFGFIGRTKWTHLVNEDTTNWDSAWYKKDGMRNAYRSKMAGSKGDLDMAGRVKRGSAKRKRV